MKYRLFRCVERLTQICNDIVDVFDPDAEPNHLGHHAGPALLFGRHLSMSRRSRVTGQRLRIAEIDEPRHQLQSIVEFHCGRKTPVDAEGHEGAGVAAQIFLRQRMIWIVGKARVINPFHPGVVAQEFGYGSSRFQYGAQLAARPFRFPVAARKSSGATK